MSSLRKYRRLPGFLAALAFAGALPLCALDAGGIRPLQSGVPTLPPNPAIEAAANKALVAPIVTIVDKPAPSPTGDAHDYISYARYYWPDPNKPSHMPYVRRDGHSNEKQVALGDEPRLVAMVDNVDRLARGWQGLHRIEYDRRAVGWLRAWFVDPATRMNPNLDRGQIALGHDDNRGRGEGILDARGLIKVVEALKTLHRSPALSPADEAAIQQWFSQYLQWMLTSRNGKAEHAAANNHGSWFLAQSIAIARYVGRDDIARDLANEDFARIAGQVEPDGRQPLELARTDGLGYSVFNLSAQYTVAGESMGLGIDLYHYTSPRGSSLRAAVDFLRPYNTAPDRWPGNQNRRMAPGFLDEVLAQEQEAPAPVR